MKMTESTETNPPVTPSNPYMDEPEGSAKPSNPYMDEPIQPKPVPDPDPDPEPDPD
jgi:hypothetical protein